MGCEKERKGCGREWGVRESGGVSGVWERMGCKRGRELDVRDREWGVREWGVRGSEWRESGV